MNWTGNLPSLPTKEERENWFQPPHPGGSDLLSTYPSKLFQKWDWEPAVDEGRGWWRRAKAGPQLQKGQAAIFNPSLGGDLVSGGWDGEKGRIPGLTDT